MRKFKKFASTALALAMILSMGVTAYAAPGDGDMAYDDSVSIAGLQDGDTVEFYQVLKWNDGWTTASGFESMAGNLEELAHGRVDVGEDGSEHTVVTGGIDSVLAGDLGRCASSASVVKSITASDGSVSYTKADGLQPGLYMAIITAGTPGYFYNPVFVAADFNPDNTVLTLRENELSYSDEGHAKLNKIDLKKTSEEITSDVGDTVHFKVETMVPVYATNYTNPVFRLTDHLSAGLKINQDVAIAEIDAANYSVEYTDDGYVLTVNPDYLKAADRDANTVATVTYTAVVTNEASFSINMDENTVTLEFSNSPSDETGAGKLRDRTNHYTFDIDGLLLGNDGYTASELVKIGVDANGNEIIERVELDNGTSVGALEGAKFTLYADEACENVYKNDIFDGTELVSDGKGYIPMKGLEAGSYWLVETEAPAGYIKSQDKVQIDIEYKTTIVPVTETDEDGTVFEYDVTVLESYSIFVKIGDKERAETASYVLENDGANLISSSQGDKVGMTDWDGKIINTVGVELPSTGGIGTTIFYVLGGCLVLGAGVLLVVKKRVGGKDEA